MTTPPPVVIALVDDNEANRYALARHLRQAGYEVREGSTGQEALGLALQQPGLMILDVNLPDANGIEICQRLKRDAKTAFLPILQISAHFTSTQDRVRGLESGADAYLGTPFESRELLAQVKALLRMRQAEAELRRAKGELQALVDNVPCGIGMTNQRGEFILANRSLECLLGGPPTGDAAGPRGQYTLHLLNGEPFPENQLPLVRALRGEEASPVELVVKRSDGTEVVALAAGAPLRDESGAVYGAVASLQDITEGKTAEARLRHEQERHEQATRSAFEEAELERRRLAAVLETLPAGVAIADKDGKVTHFNAALTRIWGSPPIPRNTGEYRGWRGRWADTGQLLTADDWAMARALRTGEVIPGDVIEIERFDGSGWTTIINAAAPIRDANGQIVGGVVAEVDITAQKQAEKAVRESEERYHLVNRATRDIIYDWNMVSGDIYWNESLETTLGYPAAGKQYGMDWWKEHLHPEDRARVSDSLQATIHQPDLTFWTAEYRFLRNNGSWASVLERGYLMRDAQGRAVRMIGTMLDLSEQKRLETELTKAKEAAEGANRAKSQFLASMSHELRTPMNAILGMTDLALNQPLPESVRDYLITAKQSADQLLELLNEILDFSRIEAGRFELEYAPFNLPGVLEQVVKTLGVQAYEKGLELVCELSENLPRHIRGDALRLRQVLTNLVGNAIKFTHHGEILLRAEVEEDQDGQVRLRFTVSDTGIGIAPEHVGKIFNAFTQADASTSRHYGGSGLGLAISQRLVSLMGGRIGVESEPGRGSTFHFTVVLAKCPQSVDQPAVELSLVESLRGRPVLVVAHNATQRRVLKQMLSDWRMEAEEAADVPSALAKIHQQAASRRNYQLILADAVMPNLNGFCLAEWLGHDAQLVGAVILMLSAADRLHYPEQCRETKHVFLDKPIARSALIHAMAKALGLGVTKMQPEAALAARSGSPAPARPLRVLLAEDTPANQKLAQLVLGSRGHAVQIALNGVEALALLEQQDFDLVLMDVQMPEMDGFEATRKIRQLDNPLKSQVPIIALTAHALKGDQEKCLAAGMNDYLSKPIKAQEMIELVERWANERITEIAQSIDVPLLPELPAEGDETNLLNLERALETCFGRYDFFQEMVGYFYAEADPIAQQMQAALRKGDGPEIARLAHRLLNTVAYLGCEPATRVLRVLEQAGQGRDLAGAAQALEEVMIWIRALKKILAGHLSEISNIG